MKGEILADLSNHNYKMNWITLEPVYLRLIDYET